MAREACPTCGQPRLGAFRFCRSCGHDYDVQPGVPIPEVTEPATQAPSPTSTPATSPTPVRPSKLVASGDPAAARGRGRRRLALPGGISPSYAAVAVIGLLGAATLIGLVRGPAREATAANGGTPAASAAPAANAAPAPVLPLTGSAVPTAPGIVPDGPTERATEVRVVDGDTIEAVVGRQQVTVHYLGVNAPDRDAPNDAAQPLADVAADLNEALLAGGTVLLERDESDVDLAGRLLRHVWTQSADGGYVLVSLELVREGLAEVATAAPDVKYEAEMKRAEADARAASIGIWGR